MIPEGKAPGVVGARAAAPSPDRSERARLARLARAAALLVPGVVGTDPGSTGLCFTASGGERVDGVTCVAAGAGGYEVSLCLVCRLVALRALGDQVSAAVRRAAAVAGIAVDVIHVHVVDIEVY
jgi:hypothetical protein